MCKNVVIDCIQEAYIHIHYLYLIRTFLIKVWKVGKFDDLEQLVISNLISGNQALWDGFGGGANSLQDCRGDIQRASCAVWGESTETHLPLWPEPCPPGSGLGPLAHLSLSGLGGQPAFWRNLSSSFFSTHKHLVMEYRQWTKNQNWST